MAKGNLFLGKAKGKVGSVVFSVLDGEQITRSLPASVANPRTYGQNVQRAIFSTIAKAAAAMSPIVDHSFVGVKYGQKSVQNFRRLNLDNLREKYLGNADVYVTPKGGGFVPNQYIIAKGNLPSFAETDTDGSWVRFEQGGTLVALPEGSESIVWDEFKTRYPYIQPGDQLTICKIVKLGDGSLADNSAGFSFTYDRIVLASDESYLRSLESILTVRGFNPSALDLTVTTNSEALRLTEGGGSVWIGLGADSQVLEGVYAVGLVLSRKVNGTWQRSNTQLSIINRDDVQDVEGAIATYDGTTDSITSDNKYLDAAISTNNAQPGSSEAYMAVHVSDENGEVSNLALYSGDTEALDANVLREGLLFNIVAYGTDENPLVALDLTGTAAGEDYVQHGTGSNRQKSLTFAPGDDGNFAGTYEVTAVYRNGQPARLTFTLTAPQPENP